MKPPPPFSPRAKGTLLGGECPSRAAHVHLAGIRYFVSVGSSPASKEIILSFKVVRSWPLLGLLWLKKQMHYASLLRPYAPPPWMPQELL